MAELVYEMLWDCRYCGARKLLGLSHRHCPNCGAAQDPNARYFPAESEKVAVQNHEYVGVDIACRYCGAASSKRAHNCGRCGAPLAEGSAVPLQLSGSAQPLLGGSAPVPPKRPAWKLWLPALALVLVSSCAVMVLWKKDHSVVAAARGWERSVVVERFGPIRTSAWCSELPAGATEVTRRREQRGTQDVPGAKQCHTERKDRGDGTFSEEEVCTTSSKSEPVYEDKCSFTIVTWSETRRASASGEGSELPRWPVLGLERRGCAELGCEREGARSERYRVAFKDDAGKGYRCDFPQQKWLRFALGQRYQGKLRALAGSLDCDSLTP